MLTATLDALVGRFGLEGEVLGEVAAGAVLKHSRDFNLARESVLGSRLAPETPAYDVQQACGTGLEATIARRQQDRPGADRLRDRRRRRHHLRRADRHQRGSARGAAGPQPHQVQRRPARTLARLRPQQIVPEIPRNAEPRTGLSMGEHTRDHGPGVGDRPRGAGRARRPQPPQARRRLRHAAGWTTWSRRSSGSSATRTCAPTPPSRSWPSSSRCSAAPTGR